MFLRGAVTNILITKTTYYNQLHQIHRHSHHQSHTQMTSRHSVHWHSESEVPDKSAQLCLKNQRHFTIQSAPKITVILQKIWQNNTWIAKDGLLDFNTRQWSMKVYFIRLKKQEPVQKSFQGTYGTWLRLIDLHSHHSGHTSNGLVYTFDWHRQTCHLHNGKVLELSL